MELRQPAFLRQDAGRHCGTVTARRLIGAVTDDGQESAAFLEIEDCRITDLYPRSRCRGSAGTHGMGLPGRDIAQAEGFTACSRRRARIEPVSCPKRARLPKSLRNAARQRPPIGMALSLERYASSESFPLILSTQRGRFTGPNDAGSGRLRPDGGLDLPSSARFQPGTTVSAADIRPLIRTIRRRS